MSDIKNDLTTALQKALDAEYRRGWNDCLDAVIKAVSAYTGDEAPAHPAAALQKKIPSSPPQKRAPKGIVPKTIKAVLTEEEGLSTSEIGDRVQERAPMVKRASIRSSLQTMLGDALMRKGDKWYLAQHNLPTGGGQGSADDSPSAPMKLTANGGLHHAAT